MRQTANTHLDDFAGRSCGEELNIAVVLHRPTLDVGLDGRVSEVDQPQPGDVHAAVCERRH